MHRLRYFAIYLFFMFIAGLAVAKAQQPTVSGQPVAVPTPGKGTQQIPTVRVKTDEVNVVFTVVDKDGRSVRDMKQEQFRITDNGLPPQKILDFRAQTDLPLFVGLLIDSSNSIRDRFQFEKDAASEFLYEIIRPQADRAFVMSFDEVPEITQDFTGDLDKLRNGIKEIKAGGGTAMWDAVYSSCRDKLLKEPARDAVRRAIILVSDGDDNLSRVLPQEAIEMAQRAGVIIYAISTSLMSSHSKGDNNLRMLAEATGGRAFFPLTLDQVSVAFSDIQQELRSQYSITYRPENLIANGEFRSIQILADSKKLKVRAKKGYFVPKE
ncbi:MAG: VWA domain-containing protein [Candidatus Angelobacter sp.]